MGLYRNYWKTTEPGALAVSLVPFINRFHRTVYIFGMEKSDMENSQGTGVICGLNWGGGCITLDYLLSFHSIINGLSWYFMLSHHNVPCSMVGAFAVETAI